MGSNPQGELEDEDDMLTQQRKNFEAEKAKGDGEMVRTTFFDYDFSQQDKNNATKKQKSKNKKKAADKPKNNHKSNYSSEISTTNNTTTNVDHPVTSNSASNSASNSSSTSYSWKRLFKCCDSSPTKRHQNNHITEVSICRRVTVTGVCPLKKIHFRS